MNKSAAKTSASSQIAQQWQNVQARFDTLAQREKIIVSLVALALVVMITQFVALDPLLHKRDAAQQALAQSSRDISALQIEVQTLNQAIVAGPKQQKKQQVEALQREAAQYDEQIGKTTKTMIPPRLMTDVLRDVLKLRSDLKLISLENLAPEPLLSDDDADTKASAATDKKAQAVAKQKVDSEVGLYRHGVTLVFEGDYMATLQFLQSLEQKPFRFFWQQLQYSVEKYPTARVTLTLYTLSPERAWLGV